ncbi:50S ribosomal protein L22 [Sulfidibacter corallicola]|uniref:Large ribosomal subunit protein uL22 n=1 Tax=Sulfidibacter corallicola TaxID=2818388 RepID=A0A8A4TE72_SULCO|nr:50S ribosomal protein L22 [Sulfidibacter corallicola]QTD47857.1 50S ribosomal protein L22 [Sulfidibacter corallicola]
MIAKAKAKYIRGSARKARLVIDQIRGEKVDRALEILRFSPKRAARHIEECLKSAIANAEQKDGMIDVDELYVSKAVVDEGPTMKRIRPRAMGRAFRINKRFNHISIELSQAGK